ncbi:MAG TPA: response regulator transcription factor [Cytophagaceae bacterium]
MIKILIGDDHVLIREGLKKVLKSEKDMSVVAEAENASDVLKFVQEKQLDIVVLDITMPGRSGLDILKELKKFHPKLPVLVLSMHAEERYAVRALKAGASGYLTKQSAGDELVAAIRKVVSGGKHISTKLAERLASELEKPKEKAYHETLSNREYQVFCKIASGESIQDIAEELSLSQSTVNTYRQRVMEKMHMSTNAELIRYALEYQLID